MKNTLMNAGFFGLMIALLQGVGMARADDAAVAPSGATAATGKGHGKMLEKRIERQHKRIQKLEEKGKISADKAAELNKNVDDIATKEQAEKANGIDKSERKELNQELNQSSEAIKKARKSKKQ